DWVPWRAELREQPPRCGTVSRPCHQCRPKVSNAPRRPAVRRSGTVGRPCHSAGGTVSRRRETVPQRRPQRGGNSTWLLTQPARHGHGKHCSSTGQVLIICSGNGPLLEGNPSSLRNSPMRFRITMAVLVLFGWATVAPAQEAALDL